MSQSDLIHKHAHSSIMEVGNCYSMPTSNRYQILDTGQEDQLSTVDDDNNGHCYGQDSSCDRYCHRYSWPFI